MPVTTGYSADPEKNYTEKSSLINATSFTSQDLRTSAGAHSSPNGSISSYSRTNSVDSLDDSQSSSSGGSASGHSRQVSNDSTTGSSDYIPTRSIKQANKPQHNALQFVKIGSCPLYIKAAEQMKKAEEVKKMKTVARQDEEDWQHNLDNWKSKRRLSCQKSQERADELRRLEEEEFNFQDKGRRKSKTFSEMVEERSKRGRNFGYFSDEWDDTDSGTKGGSWDGSDSPRHDLSIDSTSSDPVFRDDESSDTSSVDRNHPESSESKTKENGLQLGEENGNSDSSHVHKSPVNGCENGKNGEAGENGENNANPFEKAIQSYVQFAESQKKTLNHEKKAINGNLSHKSKKFTDDENILSKPIPEENGSAEEKTNGASFSGDRTGGTEMFIVVTLKSGSEHRDFGFTTKGQGRGLVFVETVSSRGPAEAAGLRVDDEVLAINGESVTNRSHSAIVFAIKQALYTGRLELGIYRYNNANQIPKQGINSAPNKKPSRIEEKKAVFSRENSNEKEPSPDKRILREKSPKVDIVKRRSLFESPPKELGEVQQQRRSLDASTALKNKILSFENLENIDKMTKPDGKRLSAKQKKQPIEKQNGTNRKSDFMKRLTSFENLESVGNNSHGNDIIRSSPERKQSLKDKIDVFEKPEMFERSRSCDFLNTDHRNDRGLISPLSNQGNLNDLRVQSPQDETASENSFDWDSVDNDNYSDDPVGPPRIIDVVTKEESPEPAKLSNETQLKTKSNESLSNASVPLNTEAKDASVHNHLPAEVEKHIPEKNVEEVVKKTVLPPVEDAEVKNEFLKNHALHSLSPFELAETLEETSFIGSNPSSPDWKNNAEFTIPSVTKENVCNGEETNKLKNNSVQDVVEVPSQISMEHEVEPLDMTHLGEELFIVDDFDFDAPPRVCEPPKEKPPPPPVESDTSFDQVDSKGTQLKRIDSTKRIKQELKRLRSDFLGFDSTSETNYLDTENLIDLKGENSNSSERKLSSDILEDLALLQQEHPKWDDKVDSSDASKELEEDVFYSDDKNEEDEIARKEKEIIEDLEREEEMKKLKSDGIYKENEPHQKVMNKDLESLEVEKQRLEDEKRRQEEEKRLREREEQLRQQEELLRLEKEKLRKEQEELMRQREEYQRQIQEYQLMHPPFLPPVGDTKTTSIPQRSLNDDGLQADFVEYPAKSLPVEGHSRMPKKETKVNNGSAVVKSSPENKVVEETFSKSVRPPPEVQLGFPDEEALPHRKLPENPPVSASHVAVPPKSKLVIKNEKCPVRRKPDANSKNSYNQHWLIQEAEMRRISEQQDRLRQARSPTRESVNEGKQFPDRTKPMTNQSSYSQRPQLTQNNFYGKPMNYASHQGQQKRPVVSSHEQFSSRSPDYVEVQTTNPLLPSKNCVQNSVGSLANGDPHMLSVSGKKKCSHCGDELGKGAAMIIESLHLFYHIHCFNCCVCHVQLGNGLSGADVRVRNQKLHCHNCYSNDEAGLKFSKV